VLTPEAAAAAIEATTGQRPLRTELLLRYEGRLVCLATLPGRRLVFKAGPVDSVRLEAWVLETVAGLGVRAPRLVAMDDRRRAFPLAYLLMEEVPGVPLAGWPSDRRLADLDLDSPAVRELLRDVGRQLRLIHSIRVPGFGQLAPGPPPHGRHASWREYLAADGRANLDALTGHRVLEAEEASDAAAVLERRIGELELAEGRLLHGDFIPRHWFVDPGTLTPTGILDFSPLSGDPALDIATADFDHRRLEPDLGPLARLLLEGYRPDDRLRHDLDARLLLYRCLRALGEAAFMQANGEDVATQLEVLRWCLRRLRGDGAA
jgi:aminoglycoside phosphotransferase (APT) family kinase protein